jgi:hypothetical protein
MEAREQALKEGKVLVPDTEKARNSQGSSSRPPCAIGPADNSTGDSVLKAVTRAGAAGKGKGQAATDSSRTGAGISYAGTIDESERSVDYMKGKLHT